MSKIGVDNLHFYPLIKDDESGVAYGAGVAIPGTVSIDISPSTNNATLYADNGAWETANTMGEVSVTIELADIPKHIHRRPPWPWIRKIHRHPPGLPSDRRYPVR